MNLPEFPAPENAGLVSGLHGSSMAFFLSRLKRPVIVVTATEEDAARLESDLAFCLGMLGRSRSVLLSSGDGGAEALLEATRAILETDPAAVVAPVEALDTTIWSREALLKASLVIRAGEEIDQGFLSELLREMGYRRMNLVAENGEFALRGGILDIFPALEEHPFRLEFFGDEVESIRAFDVDTQRSFRSVDELSVSPLKEPDGGSGLFEALPDRLVVGVGVGPEEVPAVNLRLDALRVEEEGLAVELQSVEGYGITARERRLTGEGLESIAPHIGDLARRMNVLMVSRSQGEAERLRGLLAEADVIGPVIEPSEVPAYEGGIAITRGRLSGGFMDPRSGLLIITAEEIFGARTHYRQQKRSKVANLIQSLDDLTEGDLVVHVDHGVGRFVGMKKIRVEDYEGDFLQLEYAEAARFYLPVDRIEKIRSYHSTGEAEPRLDRLGGKSWDRVKSRVRQRVMEMAGQLIKVYAERETVEGIAFSPNTDFHREFAEAFPFEETPDQQSSIMDVMADMESPKPMDRLLCGDVGYGKTEVAMRAAFKAVFDGRQVAVLVPTTILAEQHFENFQARFSAFPVNIDYLSRFKSRAGQKETLKRLAAGEVDIVIGTHALLSKTVEIPNLGLLIVDEEHKFGVRHKEKIKALRKNVDVLALSATPIPRTLHMALSGIRGISTIETPPEERLAVKTLVTRHRPEVIQEALEREFARGGQAFYVHNRIQTIYKTGASLGKLVPGRRIGVAHGRMNEKELEAVMHEFNQGDLDLLLCTSIIGSGLDVPRANTIIIDRADRFGLADLYQLKGRVGRSDLRAFAYFLIPPEDLIATESKKRLEAIQELSFLGAGFRLAMKDLEIRGAGNLLGAEQSGHIEAVGYDLYVEMLEQAVRELRNGDSRPQIDPVVELRLNAYIPEAYLEDTTLRFSLYRRIAGAKSPDALGDLGREIRDRFGPPPEELIHLMDVMDLKNACRAAGASKLSQEGTSFRVLFADTSLIDPDRAMRLSDELGCGLRFLPEGGLEIEPRLSGWEPVRDRLKTFLAGLA